MRTTLLAGVCALALTACGGDDTAAEIAETQAEIDAREAAAATQDDGVQIDTSAADAEAFLADNAARDGVRVTESGLQIETLEAGEGPSPTAENVLRFTYQVTTADGTVLDSSEGLPGPVVVPSYEAMGLPGLVEAVPQMREGERARITMPPSLAFGEQVPPGAGVGPNEVVIFEMTLVEVIAPDDEARFAELQAEQEAQQLAANAELAAQAEANAAESEAFLAKKASEDGVSATDSGLLYEVIEDGGDAGAPAATDVVRVHYHGTLPNGEIFDSSVDRGQPSEFPLNGVIAGWTEGLQLMQPGDKYRFYVPADLAYGKLGRPGIPPSQALIFEVELIEVLGGAQ